MTQPDRRKVVAMSDIELLREWQDMRSSQEVGGDDQRSSELAAELRYRRILDDTNAVPPHPSVMSDQALLQEWHGADDDNAGTKRSDDIAAELERRGIDV